MPTDITTVIIQRSLFSENAYRSSDLVLVDFAISRRTSFLIPFHIAIKIINEYRKRLEQADAKLILNPDQSIIES